MLRLDKEVDEILFLKKQIKYECSHKGGTQNTKNFVKNVVNKHKPLIGLLFYIYIIIIIYIVFNQNKHNNLVKPINNVKYIVGGESLLVSQEKKESTIPETISYITNTIINSFAGLTGVPIISVFLSFAVSLLLILIFLILILDFGLYVPCGGCQEDSRFIKCMPGTGANSITCSALQQILKIIAAASSVINDIKKQIKVIKRAIKSSIYVIKDTLITVKDFLIDILGFPLGILYDFFSFLKNIKIGNWGFNLGELLLGRKDKKAIYHLNGKLKDKHGTNAFFEVFFEIIRILLETPKIPKLDWPSFGGSTYQPIVNPDADPNNDKPAYPIDEVNISTDQHKIDKKDLPVPDIDDYNTYDQDIEENETKDDSENEKLRNQNIKERMRIKKIAKRKADATNKLIDDTNKTLNNIQGKQKRVNYIIGQINDTKKKINDLVENGKKLLKDINNTHRPNFEEIANIGTINEDGDGNDDPSQIKIKNGLYVLINITEDDLTQEQKDSFYRLNKNMTDLNNNTEQIDIQKNIILDYSKKLEIENNKIGDYKNDMKDFLYMKFLELLIQIDINPLLLISKFLNIIIIKPLNILIQKGIIKPSIKLIVMVFNIAKKLHKAIVGQLIKVAKFILIPIYKMIDAFKPILKVFYRVISIISDIGIFNMIFYYFYDKIEKALSHFLDIIPTTGGTSTKEPIKKYDQVGGRGLANIFALLCITIVVCIILIACPIIGGIYESSLFFKNLISFLFSLFWDVGLYYLIYLYYFIKSFGESFSNVLVYIYITTFDYIFNIRTNISKTIKNVGLLYSTIIFIIISPILLCILFSFYYINTNNLLQKFIISNTVNMQKRIFKKNKKTSKN